MRDLLKTPSLWPHLPAPNTILRDRLQTLHWSLGLILTSAFDSCNLLMMRIVSMLNRHQPNLYHEIYSHEHHERSPHRGQLHFPLMRNCWRGCAGGLGSSPKSNHSLFSNAPRSAADWIMASWVLSLEIIIINLADRTVWKCPKHCKKKQPEWRAGSWRLGRMSFLHFSSAQCFTHAVKWQNLRPGFPPWGLWEEFKIAAIRLTQSKGRF